MNSICIRSLLCVVAAGLFLMAGTAQAQTAWPAKPIRIVVPYLAGSFTDVAARRQALPTSRPD